MKKKLLTGGSGFIGKNILDSFLAQKYEICAPSSGILNLVDCKSVDEFFKTREFDAVLHCAVKASHRNAKDSSNTFFANVKMFENLVRHKDSFGKFIDFGSGAIYDIGKNISSVDECRIGESIAEDEHGFCKYVLHERMESLGRNFIELNIFGIFGKYEDYEIRFISNAICKSLFDLSITLRQNRRFSYLFVDDLPKILDYFLNKTPKFFSYNIASDYFCELKNVAEIVKKISGSKREINIAAQGFGLDYYADNSRLVEELGKMEFTPMDRAIEKLYKFYKDNLSIIKRDLLLNDK